MWGYDRIQGALKNVGHVVAPNTAKKALKAAGLDPAPDRGKRTPWKTFLKAHAAAIVVTDFFTTEVRTARGLVTHYTLFVIHHATRVAEIVATTTSPNALYMAQVVKALTEPVDGVLCAKKFLVMDRDAIFSEDFRTALKAEGVRALRSPPSAPNCNAFAERFVGTVRPELTDRIIFVGTASFDRALREFGAHYIADRNHQSLENELIAPRAVARRTADKFSAKKPRGSSVDARHLNRSGTPRPGANGPGFVVRGAFRRSTEMLQHTRRSAPFARRFSVARRRPGSFSSTRC